MSKSEQVTKNKNNGKESKILESISEHREIIQKIKKENNALKQEIDNEIRFSEQNDVQQTQKMEKLQEEGCLYAKKIEIETKRNKELQKQIDLIQYNLYEKKRQINSSDGNEITHLQKKVKTLEYRLEKTRQRHNEALAEIKRLKEEVNVSRRERVIFDNVFKKLETDLKLKEEELKRYIFETLQIENQRDCAMNELQKIKSQSEQEFKLFQKQYENAFKQGENSLLQSPKILLDDSKFLEASKIEEHQSPKSRKSKIKKENIVGSSNLVDQSQYEIQQYEMIFEKLKMETGVQTIEEFIELFNSQDDINKKLFEESNKLNEEIEEYENKIAELNQEVLKYEDYSQKEENQEQQKETDDLRKRVVDAQMRNDRIQKQNQEMQEELQVLLDNIPDLFEKLGCKTQENESQIDRENLNVGNLLQYLSIIEKRANEVIDIHNFISQNETQVINTQNNTLQQQSTLNEKSMIKNKSQIKDGESKRDNQKSNMVDLLNGVENVKECEKIMSINDFKEISGQEINKFKNKTVQIKKQQKSNKP